MKFMDGIFSDVLSLYNVVFLGIILAPAVIAYVMKQMVAVPIRVENKDEDY